MRKKARVAIVPELQIAIDELRDARKRNDQDAIERTSRALIRCARSHAGSMQLAEFGNEAIMMMNPDAIDGAILVACARAVERMLVGVECVEVSNEKLARFLYDRYAASSTAVRRPWDKVPEETHKSWLEEARLVRAAVRGLP
jgi:hypothetical protein